MGLRKKLSSDFGIDVNYHIIKEFHLRPTGDLYIRVDSFPAIEHRIEGKESLVKKEYVIEKADTIVMTAFYALLKKCFPDFSDSEDIIIDDWKKVEESLPEPVADKPIVKKSKKNKL